MRARFLYPIGLLFCAVLIAGCATAPGDGTRTASLKDVCSQYGVEWELDSVSQVVTLRYAGREARALIGSNIVVLQGKDIPLSGAIRRRHSAIVVPPDFKEKVIDELLTVSVEVPPVVLKKFRRIIVDAGHGGKDPGAKGKTGLWEKEVVLDISRRLTELLKERGFDVKMTRDRDEFITLERRTEIATKAKADLFVSIHANSNPLKTVNGFEVYALRELETKEKKEDQRVKNMKNMMRDLEMDQGEADLETILGDMLYSYKRSESVGLGLHVASTTSRRIDTPNRGCRTAGFFVLRNTIVPAVLIEVGYLSNGREEGLLKSGEYRQDIAEGIAESIVSYADR